MQSSSSGVAVSVSESAWSWSPAPPSRGGTCPPVMQGSIDDTSRADGFGRIARAISTVQERFESHVSTCAGVTSPTSARSTAGRAALVMISRTELYRFTSQVNNYLQVG